MVPKDSSEQALTVPAKALAASYKVVYLAGQSKTPHTITGNLIMHDEQIANILHNVPLANDRVSCCIHGMADDMKKTTDGQSKE